MTWKTSLAVIARSLILAGAAAAQTPGTPGAPPAPGDAGPDGAAGSGRHDPGPAGRHHSWHARQHDARRDPPGIA